MNEDGGYERGTEVGGKGLGGEGGGGGRVEGESDRERRDIKAEEKMIIESEASITEKSSDQIRRMREIDQSTNALTIDESANVWRILLHQLSNSMSRSQGSVETGKRRVSGENVDYNVNWNRQSDVVGENGSGDVNEGSLWLKMLKNMTNADGSWNASNLDANNVMANVNANANTTNNANVNVNAIKLCKRREPTVFRRTDQRKSTIKSR